ncbi:uncharacterized protein LOC119546726 [Drosophila subpulchrella]|uniref:uncharacterized protein LOC119546726 n=1 Tax=Drosophila subpulchrella TaxID=1486046 RepID=UPI0018A12B5A|nr:uncharacterized protein LOC119546726 [Drosophila subpulchrella]
MPHKRKTRLHVNQRNCTTRRVQLAPSAPPNVHVESCNGHGVEIPTPPRPKGKVCQLRTSCKPFTLDKLAVPQYNTTVRKQNEVRIISSVMLDKKFSPESMASIAPKVTQKMNFPMDQAVFHDLVTLNVNDSILVPKKSSFKSKTSKETEPSKLKGEPQLADYAEKVETLEMAIPEPELHLDFTPEPFDFLGAYKKIFC